MRRELVKDQAIAAIADRQGGVIARAQLAALGLGPSAIDHRVRSGRLHLVHRGVYSAGHRVVGAQGRRWAAVLACGVASVFSHASAAAAWDLRASASGLMHVTVGPGGRAGGRRSGCIGGRRCRTTRSRRWPGSPSRRPRGHCWTLLRVGCAGARSRGVARSLRAAAPARLRRSAAAPCALPRTPWLFRSSGVVVPVRGWKRRDAQRPGGARARALRQPRSAAAGGQLQHRREVRDFHWPGSRLVVEADSYAWHRSPSALSDDRERDVGLTLAGYRSLRFTWEQVTRRREYVAGALLRALATS